MAWKKVYVKGKGYRYTDGNGNYRLTNPEAKQTVKKAVKAVYGAAQSAADTLNRIQGRTTEPKPKPKPEIKEGETRLLGGQVLLTRKNGKWVRLPYGPGGSATGSGLGQAQQNAEPAAKPAAAKPKPKPAAQPAAAKPKPKPKPATLSAAEQKKRADAAHMKAELLKIKKAEEASARQKTNKAARDKAYKASLEQAKKNRERGNRPRGPRG